jgi:hypothetical protein
MEIDSLQKEIIFTKALEPKEAKPFLNDLVRKAQKDFKEKF